MKLTIVMPAGAAESGKTQKRLEQILHFVLDSYSESLSCQETEWILTKEALEKKLIFSRCQNRRILFAVPLDESGINLELYAMLKSIRTYPECFKGEIGAILVDGAGDLYTKDIAREIAMTVNSAGCLLIGAPVVEGTGELKNFAVIAAKLSTDLLGAYRSSVIGLLHRLMDFQKIYRKKPGILCIHASNRTNSNTFMLWEKVKESLGNSFDIEAISLKNGEIYDCIGCPYEECRQYGIRGSCYYNDIIVEQVYPLMEKSDAVIMVSPNYNDAISANLSALINRMTALFRKRKFYNTYLFAIIVSGYSGSDIVAKQLLDSMNMNKSFILPPYFSMMETVNGPGEILSVDGISVRIKEFTDNIKEHLLGGEENSTFRTTFP